MFVTPAEIEEMKRLYNSGMTGSQIGKILNRSKTCVTQKIRENGVTIRDIEHCGKKYTLNENYFEYIDTPEKAYWLGFIYADGCVTKNATSYKFSFGLWETDRYMLEHLSRLLDFTGPLQKEKGCSEKAQNIYDLTIYSRRFCQHLIDKGVVERKTSKLSFPWWLPKQYWKYFLHGLFDGDGCITYSTSSKTARINGMSFQASFAGSLQMMLDVQKILTSEYNIPSFLAYLKKTKGKVIMFNRSNTLKLFNLLYRDPPSFYMKRKYEKFKEIIFLLEKFLYRKSEAIKSLTLESLNTIQRNETQNSSSN
jgi:LAGLIDADG-like domain